MVRKREKFAERYHKEQRCASAGLAGSLRDILTSSQCATSPSFSFRRPLFQEARALVGSVFRRSDGLACWTFDISANQERCVRPRYSAEK